MTAIEVLKRVRHDLLEIGWVQKYAGSPDTGLCLLRWVRYEEGLYRTGAIEALRITNPHASLISAFNDAPGRTLSEIVDWVDRAIAYLESAEAIVAEAKVSSLV